MSLPKIHLILQLIVILYKSKNTFLCKLKFIMKYCMHALVCGPFWMAMSVKRKGLQERIKGLCFGYFFPCFWQQVFNKKNDFYENVIIHSKPRVGVTMKNSSLVDALSRANRSKRKETGVTKNTDCCQWQIVFGKMMSKPTENWEISSAVNERLFLQVVLIHHSKEWSLYYREATVYFFLRLWLLNILHINLCL